MIMEVVKKISGVSLGYFLRSKNNLIRKRYSELSHYEFTDKN